MPHYQRPLSDKSKKAIFYIWRQTRNLHGLLCRPPPPRKGLSWGGGKGIYIFFNFCPITMIQNINIFYIGYSFRFLNHHTCARALARAKIRRNCNISKNSHFYMNLRNIEACVFSSIFIELQQFEM